MSAVDSFFHAVESFGIRRNIYGNVVVIPGILGSDLEATVNGQTETVWPIPADLRMLQLAADGQSEAEAGRVVSAIRINHIYVALQKTLELFWNVLPFPYDWRKSISETAERLAQEVAQQFSGQPFHVVAHSMGGLIARCLLRDRPNIQNGGKLIMLGTPNYGAVLAESALESAAYAGQFLQLFGASVAPEEALAAIRSWPSVYQLLPSLSRDPASARIYQTAQPGLSARLLSEGAALHQLLDRTPVPESTICILGTAIPTVDRPLVSFDGDGVVSRRLGVLNGGTTYSLISDHLSLATQPLVLGSLTPLLYLGHSGFLR